VGAHAGPRINRTGIVLCVDAANQKSYPGSGTVVYDLSGVNNNGILVSGATHSGNAFNFGGLGELISLNSVTSLPTGTSDRTVLAFVKTPTSFSQNYVHVIHWGTDTTGNAFGLAIRSSGSLLNSHTWLAAPGQGTVLPDTVYFLAVTYTHSDITHRFWINGVSQGAGAVLSINTGTTTARIGCRISTVAENWSPSGKIYNVSVYNRALTEEEVRKNFLASKNRFGL
jgi:hypothetical protein